ncbi:MAG: division initiation protein, partial [Clostridium celatum]|nr:division initiation protein [Clostridium celatum]
YISISSAGRIDPNAEIVIKAIGDKSKLNVGVNYAGALDYGALKYYDKDIKTLDDIIINKTTQSLKSEYMTPVQ